MRLLWCHQALPRVVTAIPRALLVRDGYCPLPNSPGVPHSRLGCLGLQRYRNISILESREGQGPHQTEVFSFNLLGFDFFSSSPFSPDCFSFSLLLSLLPCSLRCHSCRRPLPPFLSLMYEDLDTFFLPFCIFKEQSNFIPQIYTLSCLSMFLALNLGLPLFQSKPIVKHIHALAPPCTMKIEHWPYSGLANPPDNLDPNCLAFITV